VVSDNTHCVFVPETNLFATLKSELVCVMYPEQLPELAVCNLTYIIGFAITSAAVNVRLPMLVTNPVPVVFEISNPEGGVTVTVFVRFVPLIVYDCSEDGKAEV